MKYSSLVCLIFLCVACMPAPKTVKTTNGAINAGAPYLWADTQFPLTLQISTDFNAAEMTNITDMSTAWEASVNNHKDFYTYGANVADVSNSVASMDLMLDNVLGVYKTTNWPPSLPSSALAVTQLFGRRYNVGATNEYVEIEHADILVNYGAPFNYDTVDVGPNYDLRAVVLHEMGHFLGLQHSTLAKGSSIMYPSINSTDGPGRRFPMSADIGEMTTKYNIVMPLMAGAIVAPTPTYERLSHDQGEAVKIMIELHADGECVHRENGTVVSRHAVK